MLDSTPSDGRVRRAILVILCTYFPCCLRSTKLAETLCHSLPENLVRLWTPLCQGLNSSSELHRVNLERRKEQWQLFQINLTYLSCLHCRPEHHLGCGHSICDTCMGIFGDGMVGFRAAMWKEVPPFADTA